MGFSYEREEMGKNKVHKYFSMYSNMSFLRDKKIQEIFKKITAHFMLTFNQFNQCVLQFLASLEVHLPEVVTEWLYARNASLSLEVFMTI